jgi:hypothetical protein
MLRGNWRCPITGIGYVRRLRIDGHQFIEQSRAAAAVAASPAATLLAVVLPPPTHPIKTGAFFRVEHLMGNDGIEGLAAVRKLTNPAHDRNCNGVSVSMSSGFSFRSVEKLATRVRRRRKFAPRHTTTKAKTKAQKHYHNKNHNKTNVVVL